MKNIKILFVLVVLLTGVIGLVGCQQSNETINTNTESEVDQNEVTVADELLVYAGAGLRKPLDEIGLAFEKEYGTKVIFTYAGSSQNCSQILLLKKGDVFVPGAEEELEPLRKENMIKQEIDLIHHIPILAVPKDNPANIKELKDLTNEGVKVGLGDPTANPIGKLGYKILEKHGLLSQVENNVVAQAATVNELIVYLALGQVDAAIVWEENTLEAQDKIKSIPIPEEQNIIKTIPVAVLSCSTEEDTARLFAEFCADKGIEIFKQHGYKPVEK